MEPIVSPWLVYLINMLDGLNLVVGLVTVVLGLGFLIRLIIAIAVTTLSERDMKDCGEGLNKGKTALNFTRWLFPLFLILSLLIPTKTTAIYMLVAEKITPNNVKVAIDAGKDIKDVVKKDILDILTAVKDKDKAPEKTTPAGSK